MSIKYYSFRRGVVEAIRENSASYKSVGDEDIRTMMSKDEYMKFILMRYKYRDNMYVVDAMDTYKHSIYVQHMIDVSFKIVDMLYKDEHDCCICALIRWTIVGIILQYLRVRRYKIYLKDMMISMINIDNMNIFHQYNVYISLSSDTNILYVNEHNETTVLDTTIIQCNDNIIDVSDDNRLYNIDNDSTNSNDDHNRHHHKIS